jgi:hypothetical protein
VNLEKAPLKVLGKNFNMFLLKPFLFKMKMFESFFLLFEIFLPCLLIDIVLGGETFCGFALVI